MTMNIILININIYKVVLQSELFDIIIKFFYIICMETILEVQLTLFRAVVDYESYNFYMYSCKILRYFILEGMWAGRSGGYG